MGLTIMADQIGRRASDQMAAKNAIDLALLDARMKTNSDEIEKFRTFKHDVSTHVQTLLTKVGNIEKAIEVIASLSSRLSDTEEAQAVHTAKCDERYGSIANYMKESKEERGAIRGMIWKSAMGICTILIGICAYFLARFGLPPMN